MPAFHRFTPLSTIPLFVAVLAFAIPPAVAHTVLEAEDATLNGVTALAHAGASGGYRVIQFDSVGDFISYDNAPAGNYIYITYSLGLTTPKRCSVYINGVQVAKAVFYPTGNWNTYKPLLLQLPVTGAVRFQIDADDQAFNAGESCASQDKIEIMTELTSDLAGLQTIHQRYYDEIMAPTMNAATTHMNAMLPDGTWSDIDYNSTSFPLAHVSRCSLMMRAYFKPTHAYYNSPQMLAAALLSFNKWMVEDWEDWNWYSNQIRVTRDCANILLVARGVIPPADWQKGLEIVHRAWPPPGGDGGQGLNLVYRVNQTVMRGVVEDDPAVVYDVMQAMADEITYPPAWVVGIQIDWSFQQHGPQLYWGGYGQGFASDISLIVPKMAQTNYALATEKLGVLASLVLNGFQWAVRGRALDPGVTGRSNVRTNFSVVANGIASICDRLIQSDSARGDELATMAATIRGEAGGAPLVGNRHFFVSDFMAHHRPGFYTSFRMASTRSYGTESGNGEGLRNYHIPDGATWLMRRGDEYFDIYPVLEWRRLPGITAEQYTEPIALVEWGHGDSGSKTEWVGGASDGHYGTATFHMIRRGVEARKAGFYFDDGFVLLGTGIKRSGGTQPVYTTLNQCLLNGDVTVRAGSTNPVVFAAGQSSSYTNLKWAHHDGTGYVPLLPGQQIAVRRVTQSGAWSDVNSNYSTNPVSKDVFSAWVNHGTNPTAGAYAYAVLPGIDTEALDAWIEEPPVAVLSNTAALQAVVHRGAKVAGAVFTQAGSLQIEEGLTISVDRPCAVVVRYGNRQFSAAVANPYNPLLTPNPPYNTNLTPPHLNQPLTVRMTVTRELVGSGVEWIEGNRTSRLTYNLPGGQTVGQSVVQGYSELTRASDVWMTLGQGD